MSENGACYQQVDHNHTFLLLFCIYMVKVCSFIVSVIIFGT